MYKPAFRPDCATVQRIQRYDPKAIAYFKIGDGNYTEAPKEVFLQAIHTFNTLEKYFLK